MNGNADKMRNALERKLSAEYLLRNFSREERYLKIFRRDMEMYLQSASWLRTPEARNFCKFWEFLADYRSLLSKMQEFGWTETFLKTSFWDWLKVLGAETSRYNRISLRLYHQHQKTFYYGRTN